MSTPWTMTLIHSVILAPPPGGGRSTRVSGSGGGDSGATHAVLRLPNGRHPTPPPPYPPPQAGEGEGGGDPPPAGEGEDCDPLLDHPASSHPEIRRRDRL